MSCSDGLYFPYRMNDGREFTDYRSQADTHRDFLNMVCTNIKDKECCDNNDSYNIKKCIQKNTNQIVSLINNNTSNKSKIKKC